MIAIIGSVGVPASYGGFETLVENLLDENDPVLLVYCSGKQYKVRHKRYKNAKLRYVNLDANGVQSIPYDVLCIIDALRQGVTAFLVLGVSGAVILPFVRLFSGVKIITNIDGLEWRRDKWSWVAKCYLKFSERLAVKSSHVVVADNEAIADYVKSEYGTSSEVIAYGGDHAVIERLELNISGDYALGLCRIEPENNVHLILAAFEAARFRLKFVGNWDNSIYGRELKAKYNGSGYIELIDPVYDVAVLFKLRSECGYYVHGHSAGGTNPSLVEVMHFAKTILCYDCDYNRATTENKAIYFEDVSDLQLAISRLSLVDNKSVGADMLEIAQRRYTWGIVKAQYLSLFDVNRDLM